ncbi:MAG: DEAD/DEAH box helicase [Deltaproteobacteria bacterium]|nr:DEAD/DEAH box helicase [Deltaproteobacteria bacterium]
MKPGADPRLKKVFARIGAPEKGPIRPDPFQVRALEAVLHADCLVSAPTGSGKTWIAEQAMRRVLEQGGRCWYASPLKALSNSKLSEFSACYGAGNVGILTGDRKENPDAPIIVGTTEILRNQLYDCMHRGEDLDTDLVVLDEAHYMGDEQRGVVWEETVIYLPPRIPLLMLSATVGNAQEIADWLSAIRQRPCEVVEECTRPVPMQPIFLHPTGFLLPLVSPQGKKEKPGLDRKVAAYLRNKDRFPLPTRRGLPPIPDILNVLRAYDLLPAIFFLKSRKDCDNALSLCPYALKDDKERKARIRQVADAVTADFPYLSGHPHRRYVERAAAASHHGGHLPAWKLVVEALMTEGLLDAVFATTTVAAGVNYPARTVVLVNSDRFNGREFVPLSSTDFLQMTGRAGRRRMDTVGFALVVPGRYMDVWHAARLVTSEPEPVDSQIRIDFSMVLNLLLSHTPDDVRIVLDHSFAAFQAAGEDEGGKAMKRVRKRLWDDFVRHLEFLRLFEYVDAGGRLTNQGRWASRLRVDRPVLIAECLKAGVFAKASPQVLAAVIAVFVQEKEPKNPVALAAQGEELTAALDAAFEAARPAAREMLEWKFDPGPFSAMPAAALFAWANQARWEEVLGVSGLADGDLAMLIVRTADNLRQLAGLTEDFPAEAAAAHRAVEIILRDPVTAYGGPSAECPLPPGHS